MATQKTPKPKPTCPVSRAQFAEHAKALTATVTGMGKTTELLVPVKHFETGSEGWYANGRMVVTIGDTPVEVQVSLTFTLIHSKDLPK